MNHLIVGLGNIGDEYKDTRHNIGFTILDSFAELSGVDFKDKRYGFVSRTKYRGREIVLLKPSTYMNLSGNAVNYWLKREKIPLTRLLVIVDDFALPTGSIRLKPKGSDGGHNGLANINNVLQTDNYARIRVGIGNSFLKGKQRDFVLGVWEDEEKVIIKEKIPLVLEMIQSFVFKGIELTMTSYNKSGKIIKSDKEQSKNRQQTDNQ